MVTEAGVTGHTVVIMRQLVSDLLVVTGDGVYLEPGYSFYLEIYGCCLALGLFFLLLRRKLEMSESWCVHIV